MPTRTIPTYAQLMNCNDGLPKGSSWGLFGKEDQLGSVNFATPECVLDAMRCVRRGKVINLDYAINAFDFSASRSHARHTIFSKHRDARDDYLDGFYLQGTSQVDGLRHRRHHEHGFYNAVPDTAVEVGTDALGIGKWAELAIVGRAVLLDVDGHLRNSGRHLDFSKGEPIEVGLLDEVVRSEGVELRSGDMLLIRTGWSRYYLEEASPVERESQKKQVRSPGLLQSRDTLAWLWDHQFALVAADNVAVEALPISDSSPFSSETDGGLMHQDLIAMLGFALGELWNLEQLAADCHSEGTFDCALVCKPLYLVGGAGSPANAVAIR